MNHTYLKNLNKIEFVVTNACTGQCKHCSQGAHNDPIERIDPMLAAKALTRTASVYDLQTVMTFGGEPLLHPEAVYAILSAATACRIPHRQVITNGYFTRDAATMRAVTRGLAACGVNDLLLSVDAFHQETIPVDAVLQFARMAKDCAIPMRLSPAWIGSPLDHNPYNQQTHAILERFAALEIPIGEGNVVFPEGNAARYLAAYFTDSRPRNPYEEDPWDVRCLSVSSNGDLLDGNLYRQDVLDILTQYAPHGRNDQP